MTLPKLIHHNIRGLAMASICAGFFASTVASAESPAVSQLTSDSGSQVVTLPAHSSQGVMSFSQALQRAGVSTGTDDKRALLLKDIAAKIAASKSRIAPTLNIDHQLTHKLLDPTLANVEVMSGTNIGGGLSVSALDPWCRSQVSLLERYRSVAIRRQNKTGTYTDANQILVQGMLKAVQANPTGTGEPTFTERALTRGLEIVNTLGVLDPATGEDDQRIIFFVLKNYYNFVINKVAKDLDLNVYLPHLNQWYNGQTRFDVSLFERKFVDYAAEQLLWVNRTLSAQVTIYGNPDVISRGSSKAYLVAAQFITLGAAEELYSSLWAYRFSCAIDKLQIANQILEGYNNGNSADYTDDHEAVYVTHGDIEEVVRAIRSADSCH